MFYWLLYPLKDSYSLFNLFRYITFRTAGATFTALLIAFVLGPKMIRFLKKHQIGQTIRSDGPQSHLKKEGTPTMGGILIIMSILIPVLLWGNLNNKALMVVFVSTVWMGLIGLIDDYLKVVKKYSKGLIGRYKLVGQFILGLVIGAWLISTPFTNSESTVRIPLVPTIRVIDLDSGAPIDIHTSETTVPFAKDVRIDLGVFYVLFVALVLAGTANAVNLTDGLDGLATGVSLISIITFGVMAYLIGHITFAQYLQFPYIPGAGEVAVFAGAMVGACIGFLWYNTAPATVFMGDTGSLALGGAIASMAIVTKTELLLLLVGGVFVAEVFSVTVQVLHFKRTGKRVFKMAPLHHHFELMGIPETKIVVRFWIVAGMLGLLALTTLKIR